jgi:hypothetical protein
MLNHLHMNMDAILFVNEAIFSHIMFEDVIRTLRENTKNKNKKTLFGLRIQYIKPCDVMENFCVQIWNKHIRIELKVVFFMLPKRC